MHTFTTTLDDGRTIIVTYTMFPAEPAAGIRRPYAEIDRVILENGSRAPELTEQEEQRLTDEACADARERKAYP